MSKICAGCGIEMQSISPSSEGYVQSDDKSICMRCFQLTNYGTYKPTKKNNSDYKKVLNKINDCDLVIYVTSILNLNLSYLNKFTNVILVVTKLDIMPKSLKEEKLKQNILALFHTKIKDIILVSSLKKINISKLYEKIEENHNSKIYFVGNTNSGKSTLINSLIDYFGKERKLTTSPYPSTTLDIVKVPLKNFTIYDTPGIIEKGSITNYLPQVMIKKINPSKEIKPRIYQKSESRILLIEDFLKIYITKNVGSLIFYLSNNIKIRQVSKKNNYLEDKYIKDITIKKGCDLVIEDLAFIKVTEDVRLKIYSLYELNIYQRISII